MDSSCNVYFTPFKTRFTTYNEYTIRDRVDGLGSCEVHGIGTVELNDEKGRKYTLHDVLYVPDAPRPLLSQTMLMEEQFEMIIERPNDPSKFYLISRTTGFTLRGGTINKLFHVWEPKSSQLAFITTRRMAKRSHDDDEDEDEDENDDGIIQKVGNENFLRESSDPQPIRGRESSPNLTILNLISPKQGTLQRSVRQHASAKPTKDNAQPSIKQPSIPSLPSQQRSQSINSRFNVDDAIIVGSDEHDNFSPGDFNLWHRRLGHTSYRNLYKLGLIPHRNDPIVSFQACDACAFAKQTRLPYRKYEHNAPRRLWRVHSDMSGIQEPSIVDGYQYFITFIDDYSRYC